VIRVWDRDSGALHAVGEAAEGLCGALAWQPNGRHLYAAARSSSSSSVLLYERNGLRHGGFDLPSDAGNFSVDATCLS
jgi:elongator complex protein 1